LQRGRPAVGCKRRLRDAQNCSRENVWAHTVPTP
jgi:hypothetical protein